MLDMTLSWKDPSGPGCATAALAGFKGCEFALRSRHHAFANEVAQVEDQRISNRIDAGGSLFPARDQTTFQQKVEVLGNVGLIRFEVGNQFRHGLFGLRQRLQDAEPKRLAQIAKAPGHQFQSST